MEEGKASLNNYNFVQGFCKDGFPKEKVVVKPPAIAVHGANWLNKLINKNINLLFNLI